MTSAKRSADVTLTKTKIVATVGPASCSREKLEQLIQAGVSIFRLNFAHGSHEWLAEIVQSIRAISAENNIPIGILGDLSGPKIRLEQLPGDQIDCLAGAKFRFVRQPIPDDFSALTCTYEFLIDDLKVDDIVLLADGCVGMRVVEKPDPDQVVCVVERPGSIRSRQGINLPGVTLRTSSLTEKDIDDLQWGLENQLDFIGYSFVRNGSDIDLLRSEIEKRNPVRTPLIVAKIEKPEAIECLTEILERTDMVMVARGDLGVEADIAKVPLLQKQIISSAREYRIPVITATQMLETMQTNPFPTRAEASDVANAVIDGTDAIMLSGETAVGHYPQNTVEQMNRIAKYAEAAIVSFPAMDPKSFGSRRARDVTEAVTAGAITSAEHFRADLIVVCTHTGKTALALSKRRPPIPILALTDDQDTSQRMCAYWGVIPLLTQVVVRDQPSEILKFVSEWGKAQGTLKPGSKVVLIAETNWSEGAHDMMLVHVVPE